MAFQQNEYAYHLHITDDEWADPLMTKYMDYSSILIILPNDIISFEKEEKENNGDIYRLYNCVAVAMHLEKLSVPQAMERTYQIFQDYEVKTKEIQQQLLDGVTPIGRIPFRRIPLGRKIMYHLAENFSISHFAEENYPI